MTFSCLLADHFGRIYMVRISMMMYIISNFSTFFSPNFYLFVFFKSLTGVGVGLFVPVFLGYLT